VSPPTRMTPRTEAVDLRSSSLTTTTAWRPVSSYTTIPPSTMESTRLVASMLSWREFNF
jgi:hypothetical protein